MRATGYTIGSLRKAFAKKEVSAAEIYDAYAKRIGGEGKKLNAFLSVSDGFVPYERESSPLAGVPYAAKDNMLVAGGVSTAGSRILEKYVASYDATVIARLRAADAQLLGKTNMDEFAMGSSGENSAYGPVRNPLDTSRVPGGSSAGSAAAVAADLCVFSLGSDTGGSIRQPASLCGIVGLKPTYGRVSRHGLIALASSLDQIGPLTKTVRDAAEVMNVISGEDAMDATSAPVPVADHTETLDAGVAGMKIGVPKEYFGRGLSEEVDERVRAAIDGLSNAGADIVEVSLPHTPYALAVYYIVLPSEASANLARFDGIRYGLSKKADAILDVYTSSRAKGFGPEPARRILLGTYALSAGYFDAYYLQAQRVRALVRKDFDDAFRSVDVIVGPTSPTTAFKLGERTADPLAMYLSDVYTVPVNLAGVPAISVPCGNGAASGLPVGFQVIGPMFGEQKVLQVASAVERLGL
ncbi:MAG TPA: Asp-tRNA(Asn)/Glu-tRNA(Gln) amidotransferase subunit GatA [Candidatus Paceibacterota bacterium]|nr:Asp-tRNA(Asn)/Glu-tRNA(Gln) amidotransferase subunit GatA [Candidatus Paceibacterota bacterium]